MKEVKRYLLLIIKNKYKEKLLSSINFHYLKDNVENIQDNSISYEFIVLILEKIYSNNDENIVYSFSEALKINKELRKQFRKLLKLLS